MKKRILAKGLLQVAFPFIFLWSIHLQAAAKEETEAGLIYIVPVKGEIERGLAYFVRRSVIEAQNKKAQALIIHMDTHGGELQATEMIMDALLDSSVETYTFVDKRAFSAGAFIAVSTKHIYMAPAGMIGAATPVAISPTGSPQETGGSFEEKITSGVRALMGAAAEENGHPRKIAEAMVDRDIEIEGIIEKGKLLTLTSKDAESEKIGFSEGTFDDIDLLIAKIGGEKVKRVHMEISWAERMARFLTSSGVRGLLLMLGLLGIYVEIKTPGFGIGGTVALLSFSLFFFGHYIAGLAGWEELIVFMLGVILLGIEIFLIPGFGIVGLSGIALILVSFILSMTGVKPFPVTPWWSQKQYEQALYSLAIAILGSFALGFFVLRFLLPKTPFWGKISLESAETKEEGFSVESLEKFLGMKGVTRTVLRPSGKAIFGEEILDVVTEGEMVPKGTKVRVIRVDGNRIVVEKSGR